MLRKSGFGILAGLALLTTQTGYSAWEDLVKGQNTVFGQRTPVLTVDQQADMLKHFSEGKSYIHAEPTNDPQCVWNRLTVYSVLDVSTEVAAAYLADFIVDKDAFPEDVESVTIVDDDFKATATPNVEFVVRLIPLTEHDGSVMAAVKDHLNDKFVMKYELASQVKDGETVYSIQKKMPKGSWTLKRNEAYSYLEPFKAVKNNNAPQENKKQTLFVYQALVCPRLRWISGNFQKDVDLKAVAVAATEKKNIESQHEADIERRVHHLHTLLGIK